MDKATCQVAGCENAAFSRGWCGKHYQRWRTTGSPERRCPTCGVEINGPGQAVYCSPDCRPHCSVEGCDRPVRKRDWCGRHYALWWDHTHKAQSPSESTGSRWVWYGEDITYGHAHKRVRNARGLPQDYACVDCGDPAIEWSYDHADPDEKHDDEGRVFSLNPEHYEPRCVRCHRIADGNPIAMRAVRP